MKQAEKCRDVDVAIIGGGVVGSALFYVLSKYSNIKNIALIEKETAIAQIASHSTSNSQTLHCGDIETNYTYEKAKSTKDRAFMLKNYCLRNGLKDKGIYSMQKLSIGVGDKECEFIKHRHEEIKELYPYLELYNKEQLKEMEPNIVLDENGKERPENIVASGCKEDYCALDFEIVAKSFVKNAQKENPNSEVFLNHKVRNITKNADKTFSIHFKVSKQKDIKAKFVLVDAGGFSLVLAQKMGYGMDLACFPVAGSFYYVPDLLKGKVYCVQNPKLPFAALHGDPDVCHGGETRMGPTALAMPKLERNMHIFGGISWPVVRMTFEINTLITALKLLADPTILFYLMRNIFFEMPLIGPYLFARDARKIIPSLKASQVTYAQGGGEVRPQVINRTTRKLELGEKAIDTGEGITFNTTPSPGATSSLANAVRDAKSICKYLKATFDEDAIKKDLM